MKDDVHQRILSYPALRLRPSPSSPLDHPPLGGIGGEMKEHRQ